MQFYKFSTDIGNIVVVEKDKNLHRLFFGKDIIPDGYVYGETPLLKEAEKQIRAYLDGKLITFNLPLAPEGTDFMKSVWCCLQEIPYGKTAHYGEIAEKIGSPGASRAVGLANNKNPIPLIIPCHRVIGKDGSLTGYRGGLDMKKRLLDMESRSK